MPNKKALSKKVPKNYKAKSQAKKSNFSLSKLIPRTPKTQILAVALIFGLIGGGLMVYKSFAASYSFTRRPQDQMTGGVLRQSGGVYRRNLEVKQYNSGLEGVKTLVSRNDAVNSSKICATFVVNKDVASSITVEMVADANGRGGLMGYFTLPRGVKAGDRKQLCSTAVYQMDHSIVIQAGGGQADLSNSIGVLSIYGIR